MLTEQTCEPGTMPALGQTTCAPVAVAAACAAGFARDPSGWGCAPVLPSSACTGATLEKLGAAACAPVGDCNATFPPAGATILVNTSFSAGQLDATHFQSIAAAIAGAPAGAVIAVEAGTYTETLAPNKDVRLVGRCPAQVTLASPGADTAGVTVSSAITVAVEGMTLSGHLGAVASSAGAHVALRDAVVLASRGAGLTATGAGTTLTVERAAVRGSVGRGIDVGAGTALTLRDVVVAGNTEIGVRVAGAGATADAERAVVRDTRTTASGDLGLGLAVRDGATADVRSVALVGNHEVAVLVYGKTAHATFTDVVVSDTAVSAFGTGRGFLVDGGLLDLSRVTVTASRDVGILAEAGGQVNGHDTVVRATTASSSGQNGFGVGAISAGAASFTSSAIVDSVQAGVSGTGAGARVAIDATMVVGTKSAADGSAGAAINLESGASGDLRGAALVGNTGAAIHAIDPGTTVSVASSVVLGTKPGAGGRQGRGVSIEDGASATVTTTAVIANHDVGISVRGAGASATLDEVVVRGTLPQVSDGTRGRGLEVGSGAHAAVSRASLLDNHQTAALAIDAGSALDLKDSWIAGTVPDATPGAPGRALTAQDGASATVLGVVVENNRQIGVVAARSAALVIESSVIDGTAAGDDGTFGHGVLAVEGASTLLTDVTVSGSAGVGLLFSNARGSIWRSRVASNAVGIAAQDGSALREAVDPPADPADDEVVASSDSRFEGNGTRVGSGALPLPAPL